MASVTDLDREYCARSTAGRDDESRARGIAEAHSKQGCVVPHNRERTPRGDACRGSLARFLARGRSGGVEGERVADAGAGAASDGPPAGSEARRGQMAELGE